MAIFVVGATRSRVNAPAKTTSTTYIEVDPLPQTKDRTKNQVVQSEAGTKTAKAAPDAFLGEQTQVVEKQKMSMPKVGTAPKTSHGQQAKAQPQDQPQIQTPPPAKALMGTGALAKFGIAIPTGKETQSRPKKRNPIEEAALTAQARGEYVKGFKEGEQTLLNTREFVFYGYFKRIRERLDRAWEKSLRDRLAKYFYRGRQLASETDYTTQIMVSLDDSGRITRVQIIGASGTKDLDEAAIKAFNDAGPFPNPPRGLVDPEGQVLVRWDFVLKT